MKKLLLTLSLSLAALAAHAETYAVMIGICDYPDIVDSSGKPVMDKDTGKALTNDLNGCVNDIKAYETLLKGKFGVKSENVRLLLDKDANEDGFVKGLKWLLSVVKPGDQAMFFYSGHGTQYDSKTEADGTQEAIVLADMTLVDGDLFHSLSQALSKSGVNATFVFDSCFSGGMSRAPMSVTFDGQAALARQRYITPAELKRMPKSTVFPKLKEADLKAIPRKKGQAAGGSYAFIMAGNDKQTTSDLQFKDPAKPARGLFSLVFCGGVDQLPDLAVDNIVKQVEQIILKAKYNQNPTAEYSSEARGQMPFYLKG